MEPEIEGLVRPAESEETKPLVTYSVKPRRLGMRIVSRQELQDIGATSAVTSLYLTLLGIAAGALLMAAGTLATVEIKSPYIYATFWAVMIVSLLAAGCFGVLGGMAWKKYKQQIATIEEESVVRESE
jgi:hypothetical protein